MHSSISLVAAATLLSFATASPLQVRDRTCTAPQQWYSCGWPQVTWRGCCSVNPCKGPQEGVASHCPDDTPSTPPTPPSTPSYTATSSSTCAPATPTRDTDYLQYCKEDNSDCNWAAQFFTIKTYNETYASNRSDQFHAQKDEGRDARRRDVIALFTGIPEHVKECSVQWYKPAMGIFYGTAGDGSLNISTLDTSGKSFADAVGPDVTFKAAKALLDTETYTGILDLGNWGRTAGSANLVGTTFECKAVGGEVAVHFALSAEWEGSVVVDQVKELGGNNNNFVQRAGWYLKYQ